LRPVRGPHPRPEYRADGQSEYGVVSARGDVRHPADRSPHQAATGAWRDRYRRAAHRLHRGCHRVRSTQCDRRDDSSCAADAGNGSRGAQYASKRRRDAVKAFGYVNPANEKEAVAALKSGGTALPLAGGMDLLARMKDYIQQPDRIVNVKNALEATAVRTSDGGMKIGAAMKIVDLLENQEVARSYPALARAAGEIGTPQIRNSGTVGGNINQRPRCWYFRNEEFVCFKKGGNRCFSPTGENQFHAIFGNNGPSHIVHPSNLAVPLVAYGAKFR